MSIARLAPAFTLVGLLLACDGGAGPEDRVDVAPPPPGTWVPLVSGHYELPPGHEGGSTYRARLDRTVRIRGFRPVAPPGTHHIVLATGGQHGRDQLFVSVLGTEAFLFPDGVGYELPAGTELTMETHEVNTGDAPLAGTSAVEVLVADADTPMVRAEQLYPARRTGVVPPGASSIQGVCTVTEPGTLFAAMPHMHWWGTHFRVELEHAGARTVLYDEDFDPVHQVYKAIGLVGVVPGDRLHITCTYDNPTGASIPLGDASNVEMCQAMLYRYPATTGAKAHCTE